MPQLSDLVQKRKFIKKEYRPWDLSGSGTVDGKETANSQLKSNGTNQVPAEETIATNEKSVLVENISINQKDNPVIKPPESAQLTGNKTGNETGNKQVTNREQRVNDKITTGNLTDNTKVTIREQQDNKIDNVMSNIDDLPYLIGSVKKLVGIQKNIFYYVISICSARGALDTGSILSNDLAIAAHCSIGSAKTSLIRLIEKKLILRLQGKQSRGGHMVLGITKEIQAAAIQAQQALFNPFKMTTLDNITGNNTSNINPYSNSNNKINTTTSLPDTWKKINFEALQHIGFSETQLRQLFDINMTTPEIVQDAINRFAYGLEYNDKVKAYTDPLNVLMGVLRKGQRWNEPNYVSPKDLALRQLVEEKRKQKEEREALIKELVELQFPEWRQNLTEVQIREIVPTEMLNQKHTSPIIGTLRKYFTENILIPSLDVD